MSTRTDEKADDPVPEEESRSTQPRRLAIRLSTAITTLIAAITVIAIAVLTTMLISARSDVSARDARAADEQHAIQVALDYAVGASTIDYRDTKAWYGKLKADTTTHWPPNSMPPPPSSTRSCCPCSGPPPPARSPQS